MEESKGGRSKESLILILKQGSQILKMWDFQLAKLTTWFGMSRTIRDVYLMTTLRKPLSRSSIVIIVIEVNEPKWNSSTWYEHC
jgi:hypothetical protein